MKILIAGASGFVGTALKKYLNQRGYKVYILNRAKSHNDVVKFKKNSNYPYWDIGRSIIEMGNKNYFDVVINLCGDNIGSSFWTKKKKKNILNSRVDSTKLLVEYFLKMEKMAPSLFINASGISIYNGLNNYDIKENKYTLSNSKNTDFLKTVVIKWEKVCFQIEKLKKTRVVALRLGLVMGGKGGILSKMAFAYRLGLGAVLGNGQHFMSWVSLHDVLRIINFIIKNKKINGAINVVSEKPVRNIEFSKTLAKVFNKPCFLKIPKFFIKMIFGEMGDYTILSSLKIYPKKLLKHNFTFKHSKLKDCLYDIYGK